MEIRKNAALLSLAVLVLGSLIGCGSSSWRPPTEVATKGPSGKVTQGAVSGATVWADNLTAGTRFVIDSDEQATKTTTDANGTFNLPIQPSYKYVIVSQGGTDTITGKTATTMLAPAGSNSVSALTTTVALDTHCNLASAINGILPTGKTFDSDLTAVGGLTPAAMVFVQSLESAVTIVNQAIVTAANASGATLSQQQKDNINLTIYSKFASDFCSLSPACLSNTQCLAAYLQTALSDALAQIGTNNPNIALQNTAAMAASIANNSVATSANVVGNATGVTALQNVTPSNVQSAPVTVSTSSTVTESTVMATGSNTQTVNNNINTVSQTQASSITPTSTPSSYTPPVITVINNPTITGYQLSVTASGDVWSVATLKISFSDDMVATTSGDSTFGHSVLNPANYQFTPAVCSPASYSSKEVSFSCGNLPVGTFGITIYQSSSNNGVWASATSIGLAVNNSKTFTLPTTTGSTGGSSLDLF